MSKPLNTFACPDCSKRWTDHECKNPGPEFCHCGQLVAPDHHPDDPGFNDPVDPNPEPITELNKYFPPA